MTHLKDHIEILKNVLQDVCVDGLTIPKATIYNSFNQRLKTDIEKYRFSKEMSELIRDGHIKGYKIKVGRNGGVSKDEIPINIRLIYPNGDVIGSVDPESLQKLLGLIKPNKKDNGT
jgi:hypothetical protein